MLQNMPLNSLYTRPPLPADTPYAQPATIPRPQKIRRVAPAVSFVRGPSVFDGRQETLIPQKAAGAIPGRGRLIVPSIDSGVDASFLKQSRDARIISGPAVGLLDIGWYSHSRLLNGGS